MENRAFAIATGLFVVLLGAVLLAFAYWLSGGAHRGVTFDVVTKDTVAGLNPGSSVRLRGVEIGQVQSIGFDPQNPRLVRVRVSVNPDIPLMEGTRATQRSIGLSGADYIELTYPDEASHRLEPSDSAPPRIPMRRSGLSQLTDSSDQLFKEFSDTLQRVDAVLTPETARHFSHMVVQIDAAFAQITALAEDLRPATHRFGALTAGAEGVIRASQTTVRDADSLIVQIRSRVDAIDAVRDSAHDAGRAARDVQQSLVNDTLPRIDALADGLSRNSETLDRLLQELQDQPQSVVFGLPPASPGPGEHGFHAAKR
jgi:phospholipid/cholesterol/gamma-HCH transport system substrate-binding protein